MPAFSLGHASGDGGLEAVVDHLLGGSNLRCLLLSQLPLPAEHLRLERTTMIEWLDVQRLIITNVHNVFFLQLAVTADQTVGGAVMSEFGFCFGFQFRDNALGQHFAQFHAPLVERVDVPDRALGKDTVLIKSNQLAENLRRELFGEDRVRRAIALENAMGHEPVWRALGLHLLGRLAEGQRFGLGKDVGQEHIVVAAQRIERLDKRDEVARDQPRPLMNQLIEGVLAVGSRLAPIDRPGRIIDFHCHRA